MRYKEIYTEAPDDGNRAQVLRKGPPYPAEQADAVKKLQTELQRLGYFVGSTGIDGKYGPNTARAVATYKADHKRSGDADTITQSELEYMSSADPVREPTQRFQGPGERPSQPGNLEGTNVLAQNSSPASLPNQNIIDALDRAAGQLGIQVQITPNGGKAGRDSGTQNHPGGHAADFQIIKDGQLLRPPQASQLYDELITTLVSNASQRGIRPGIGGYTWGIHYDESPWRQDQGGIAGTWNNGYDVSGAVAAV